MNFELLLNIVLSVINIVSFFLNLYVVYNIKKEVHRIDESGRLLGYNNQSLNNHISNSLENDPDDINDL